MSVKTTRILQLDEYMNIEEALAEAAKYTSPDVDVVFKNRGEIVTAIYGLTIVEGIINHMYKHIKKEPECERWRLCPTPEMLEKTKVLDESDEEIYLHIDGFQEKDKGTLVYMRLWLEGFDKDICVINEDGDVFLNKCHYKLDKLENINEDYMGI